MDLDGVVPGSTSAAMQPPHSKMYTLEATEASKRDRGHHKGLRYRPNTRRNDLTTEASRATATRISSIIHGLQDQRCPNTACKAPHFRTGARPSTQHTAAKLAH